MYDQLIFERSREGRVGYNLPPALQKKYSIPSQFKRGPSFDMPEVSEVDVIRHFTNMSQKNYGIDQGFYPLGSCTMKYNPKINDVLVKNEGFTNIHPLQPIETVQGALEVYDLLSQHLSEITGMAGFSFNEFAGAHGELVGLMIMKEYHLARGDLKRTKILVPTSAHGTNPASATVCGFETVEVATTADGFVDMESLEKNLNDEIAGIMLTNPNTVGLYEKDICKISKMLHENGSLLYYDGANLNALLGYARPFDMGFDIIHLNLHKTFSTPHGGGGPGSGPVGVRKDLLDFLPNPQVRKVDERYELYHNPKSIGRVSGFYGNFLVSLRAYFYILSVGKENMKDISKLAVLNANYIKESLRSHYVLPIDRPCMHEVVFDGLINGKATTLEVAKRLLDYGYHPPTIYFPLLYHQTLMVEPTEVESKETLDGFIAAMKTISDEAESNPEMLRNAPHTTPVRRLDEATAARNPIVKFKDIRNE
jgi:glycine dehydrogenase subunit 2